MAGKRKCFPALLLVMRKWWHGLLASAQLQKGDRNLSIRRITGTCKCQEKISLRWHIDNEAC